MTQCPVVTRAAGRAGRRSGPPVLALAGLLVLAPGGVLAEPCDSSLCATLTADTWDGIHARHCAPATCPPKSVFASEHCADRAAGIALCQAVMSAGDCTGVPQDDGRVAYRATLPSPVGRDGNSGDACPDTSQATVVYQPESVQAGGHVVTQFPGW